MAGRRRGRTWRAGLPAALAVAVLAGCGPVAGGSHAATGGSRPTPEGTTAAASATPEPSQRTGTPSASAVPTPSVTTPSPSSTPTPTPSPPRTSEPAPSSPTATAQPSPSATPTPEPPKDLVLGSRGPKVRALQERLAELGYWLGEVDGSFGHLTHQAVLAYQKAAGIRRDGAVGPTTQAALDRGIRPTTVLDGDGVDIDLDRQLLLVVRDGQVRIILNTSTGNGQPYTSTRGRPAIARTPTGSFEVWYKVDGEQENSLGKLWRPIYFNASIAVHGSGSIPAYPASHGCARVSNAAINKIWAEKLMPMGSTVIVR